MPKEQIICIGASAGRIEAFRTLVGGLLTNFNAAILVVLHTSPQSPGILGDILNRVGTLPAANAIDRERIRSGHIYGDGLHEELLRRAQEINRSAELMKQASMDKGKPNG